VSCWLYRAIVQPRHTHIPAVPESSNAHAVEVVPVTSPARGWLPLVMPIQPTGFLPVHSWLLQWPVLISGMFGAYTSGGQRQGGSNDPGSLSPDPLRIHRNDQHPALCTHPESPVLSMRIRWLFKALIVGLVTPATRLNCAFTSNFLQDSRRLLHASPASLPVNPRPGG